MSLILEAKVLEEEEDEMKYLRGVNIEFAGLLREFDNRRSLNGAGAVGTGQKVVQMRLGPQQHAALSPNC